MQKTTKSKGTLSVVIIAICVAAVMGLLALVLLLGYFGAGTAAGATAVVVLCALLYLAVAGGAIAAMVQRLREIRGGEEDEARKY